MIRILEGLAFCFPYLVCAFFAAVIAVATTGCTAASGQSAAQTRNFATTAATTAAGAYVGAKEGSGGAKNAALGAAAGFVVGETINYFSNKAQREAFLAGYEKGQSNAVKQQYWITRENQKPRQDDDLEETLYEISVPQTDRDGVRREATKRVIRVVMPKGGTGS
jgi:hypothetical protein